MKVSQPYIVYNSDGFRHEIYRKHGISHFYTFTITNQSEVAAVPDGCFNMVFQYLNGEMHAFASGSVLSYTKYEWAKGSQIFGVCFTPGSRPAKWKKPLRDLSGRMIEIDDTMWDIKIVEALADQYGFQNRIRTFLKKYLENVPEQVRPYGKQELILSVQDMIRGSDGKIRVSQLAERTGYSERYINKVFMEQMGYSPKNYCKIIQFQKAMEFLTSGSTEKMTNAAVELGYYDQPQFIRDFERYAGMTPVRFMKYIDKVCL